MKLELRGHQERYAVEQSLLTLFPGELPVYEPVLPGDDNWAVVSCREEGGRLTATTDLSYRGQRCHGFSTAALAGDAYRQEGQRRHAVAASFYLAAMETRDASPPWGMLTGVRPGKLVTAALERGETLQAARTMLEREYGVSPERAELAAETGALACGTAKNLGPKDIAVYIGIPFCPTRCAYCSFVSQSVERSFALVEPYVEALLEELREGGAMVRETGLRVRSVYMGGGTPTTLTAEQLDRVLGAFRAAFDLNRCREFTVEAGRPDTITPEKLRVLEDRGVTRLSVNPQTMEDRVLTAIGRRHTAGDIERAMELVGRYRFPHINMDLIAGLPEDTPDGFRRSLERCLAFGTDNVTVHTLALKKGSRILTEGLSIPTPEAVGEMLDYAAPVLRQRGYRPYYLYRQKYMSGSFENVGWSLPGAECLYNIAIMSELCGILSFGAGGSTKMVDRGKNRIQRVFNAKYPTEYIQRPEKRRANQRAFAAFYREDGKEKEAAYGEREVECVSGGGVRGGAAGGGSGG